jgi:hypothetical protein
MLLPLLFTSGAWIASDAARELADDIETTRLRLRWTRKVMAGCMGLTEQQLSNQLTLKEPLNVYRLADLSSDFWRVFILIRAERIGQHVIEDAGLRELIEAVCILTRRRRVLTVSLPSRGKERVG